MKVRYDPKADILYILIKEGKSLTLTKLMKMFG